MLPADFLTRPIAHRALHDKAAGRVENSPSAIQAAIKKGYGIEIDLQLSKDGVPMVFHDYALNRLTNETGAVAQRTSAELSQITLTGGTDTIPTFAEVLEQVSGRVPLLIEIKDQDGALGPKVGPLEDATAALLKDYKGPVAVMSFNPHSVAHMATVLPDIPRGLTTCNYVSEDWPAIPKVTRERLALIPDYETAGACFISHQHDELDAKRVAELAEMGAKILCWTIRSTEEEKKLAKSRITSLSKGISLDHANRPHSFVAMTDVIEISMRSAIADIPAEDWDACANPSGGRPVDPFTAHRFLSALELSGSVGRGTGWDPRYLVATKADQIIGVAPLYVKSHSQGEYVFDHSWADALQRAGGQYYPKLQIAVPFTPATGRRFLTRAGYEAEALSALIQGTVQLASDNGLSSMHVTFCTEDEAIAGQSMGLLHRVGQQFHWKNRGYDSFDDFLNDLSSRKRKAIRKEREQAQRFGGEIKGFTGDEIQAEHWDYFWRFYQDTGSRKWGSPYLTRAFFDIAQNTLRDDILLVLALSDDRPVAGALNFIGRDTLFGRYWGCTEHHPCLHFELCYYQAIDYAIAHGLRVEAGAQGEHKLARGYLPTPTHSLHWIANPSFRAAVSDFLDHERQLIDEEIEILTDYGPFKSTTIEEQD